MRNHSPHAAPESLVQHRNGYENRRKRGPMRIPTRSTLAAAIVAILALNVLALTPAVADETCNSPYITKLIQGQEDYVYVWTLGVDGLGDGSDKLVTIDVHPKSPTYGKVVHSVSVGARAEAH